MAADTIRPSGRLFMDALSQSSAAGSERHGGGRRAPAPGSRENPRMPEPTPSPALPPLPLPTGIRSRHVHGVNGLTMHLLEAGHEEPGRPCLLLLHGFPELAWSWRQVMLPLAAAGYRVIAPDQRGYGRTTGWDGRYDGDLASFRTLNLVRDALALVSALGLREVAAVIGHDFGSPVAAWCALVRPDVFRSVALMSAPFAGPPPLPFDTAGREDADIRPPATLAALDPALAALPRPRKHYQAYYSTREAERDMLDCPQGLHAFLRAYYHVKSADWPHNRPHPLASTGAEAYALLPDYYVMDRALDMAQTVAPHMPTPEAIAACRWLPDDELGVYADEYGRTGFQGGLQWYRCSLDPAQATELQLFSGRSIDVPSVFIAGASDWGIHQRPGGLERMQRSACSRMLGCHLIDAAGHWVQQEQPEAVVRHLLDFLAAA
ncbi:alpha/beta hydrolase [Quisquiliibacterium transsilvanicum]